MWDCQSWIDSTVKLIAVGGFSYLFLKVLLADAIDRAFRNTGTTDGLPEISFSNPIAHMRLFWYIYATPLRRIPGLSVRVYIFLLRLVIIPTFVTMILFLLLGSSSSNDPTQCWAWLPKH